MALESRRHALSYADFLQLPPESPGEVIDGDLIVGPAPFTDHQRITGRLFVHLTNYLDAQPEIGVAYIAPTDVVLRTERPAVIVQPDILFVSAARESIIERAVMGAPELVVEVVSPSTKRIDAVTKLRLYARYGVREYWLVWPEEERIDVFSAENHYEEPRELAMGDALTSSLLPGFELPLARIFAKRPADPT